jgi:hypothetical protein
MKVICRTSTKNTSKPASRSRSNCETVGEESLDGIWQKFHVTTAAEEVPPPNAITTSAYAALNKVRWFVADNILQRAVADGKLTSGFFRTLMADGRTRNVRHYWPVK